MCGITLPRGRVCVCGPSGSCLGRIVAGFCVVVLCVLYLSKGCSFDKSLSMAPKRRRRASRRKASKKGGKRRSAKRRSAKKAAPKRRRSRRRTRSFLYQDGTEGALNICRSFC